MSDLHDIMLGLLRFADRVLIF